MGDESRRSREDASLTRVSQSNASDISRPAQVSVMRRTPTVQFGTTDEQSPASFASGLYGVSRHSSDESPVISPADRPRGRRSRISVLSTKSGKSVMNLAGLAAIEDMARKSRNATLDKDIRPSSSSRDLADALEAVEELCHVARDTEMVTMEIEEENYRLREELYASENTLLSMQFQDTPLKERQEIFETWREYQAQIGTLESEAFRKDHHFAQERREHAILERTLTDEVNSLKSELLKQQQMRLTQRTMMTSDSVVESETRKVLTWEQDLKLASDAVEKESEQCARLMEHIQSLEGELAAARTEQRSSMIPEQDSERCMLLERIRFLESEVKSLSKVSERADKKQAALSRMDQLRERIRTLQQNAMENSSPAQKLLEIPGLEARAVTAPVASEEAVAERETRLEARVEDLEKRLKRTYSDCPHGEILNIWGSMEKASRRLEDLELALRKGNSVQ